MKFNLKGYFILKLYYVSGTKVVYVKVVCYFLNYKNIFLRVLVSRFLDVPDRYPSFHIQTFTWDIQLQANTCVYRVFIPMQQA